MISRKNQVSFYYDCPSFTFKNRNALKRFLVGLFKKEKLTLDSLSYVFCTDKVLRSMNQHFLNHPDYTDILTFPFSDPGESVSGEIYISVDRVRDNAKKFGVSFQNELLRVIFHGALHLCGYNDHTNREIRLMRERETHYINQFNIKRLGAF